MKLGYANARWPNDIEHWFGLEIQELRRRGHDVYQWSLRGEQPDKRKIHELDFAVYHFAHVAINYAPLKIPFGLITHTNDVFPDKGLKVRLASRFRNCKWISYQSLYHKKFFESLHLRKPLVYIPMSVRVDLFKRKKAFGSNIIAGGRLVPRKGLDRIIPYLDNLKIFGDGPLRRELELLNPNVKFVGHLYGEDLRRFYEDAWLYLFPARITKDGNRDGIPNTIKEAMLMELQVIASPVAGIPELENIHILEDWSKESLLKMIDSIPRTYNKKGREEILKKYSPKVSVDYILEAIEKYG